MRVGSPDWRMIRPARLPTSALPPGERSQDFLDALVPKRGFQPRNQIVVDLAFGEQHPAAVHVLHREPHLRVVRPVRRGRAGGIVAIHLLRGGGMAAQQGGQSDEGRELTHA